MSYPTEPKKVLIQARCIEVLEKLGGLGDYFYAPGQVQGKATNWKERQADVSYDVVFLGAEEAPIHRSGNMIEETFTIAVIGSFRVDDGDVQRAIGRGLQDVRRAVFADMEAGTADSLGTLALALRLGPWTNGIGADQAERSGRFQQDFQFRTSGKIEDL